MAIAESSESTIYLGKSTIEGTEATTYETITPISHDLALQAGSFQSDDIDPSGKGLDSFRTSKSGAGSLVAHWRPAIFDSLIEATMRGSFAAADSVGPLTVSFGTPGSDGSQTITDDGVDGFAGAFNVVGDFVNVTGAGDSGNNGIKRILAHTDDMITVYNPGGTLAAADAGCSFDNNGVATLGTTKAWMWLERLLSDGTDLLYSEHYGDLVPESLSLVFPAAGPSRLTARFQGDSPTLTYSAGSPPVTKQRGGSDNSASTARLVHGMDDVGEIVLFSGTVGDVIMTSLVNSIEFTISRDIRQDAAVGTSSIINTSASRPRISGRFGMFLNDAVSGGGYITNFLDTNPDDLDWHIRFGATTATSYGVWMESVRFQAAPIPVAGNNQASIINGEFSATDVRVSRFA